MLAGWIFVSCVALLSVTQSSADCTTANTTYYNDVSCQTAATQLSTGHASTSHTMMICDAGQQCNTLIGNIASSCRQQPPRNQVSSTPVMIF